MELGTCSLEKDNQKEIREFFQCLKRLSKAQVSRPVPCCSKYQTRTMDRTSKETDFDAVRNLSFEPMELFNCGANCSPSKTANSAALGGNEKNKSCRGCSDNFLVSVSSVYVSFVFLGSLTQSARHVSEEKLLRTRCLPTMFPSW